MKLIDRIKYELKKEFSQESPVIKKDCKHLILQKFPKDLYSCIDCHRTFQIHLWLSEIKMNKITYQELEAS